MGRIAERNYDIFIAYHGTYDSNGSCSKAEQLCDFLESKGYSVFFFPRYPGDAYKANYLAVMQSKTFLLVCNDHIARDEDGKINKVEHYDLSYEIDAFYALTQTQHDVSVQDAKVLMYGNDPLGAEAELHELFANRPHFRAVKEKDDDIFHEVYDWLKNRLPAMYLIDNFNRRHTGIWYSREYFEHHIDDMNRFLSVDENGNYIVKKITMCCYTAGSILNPGAVTNVSRRTARRLSDAINLLLNEDIHFNLELIITDPNSKAAGEAITHQKIGNINKHTFYDSLQKLHKCFDSDAENGIFRERWKQGFICKVTDLSLPYSILKVEYKEGYTHLNHIKIDLYSPLLDVNAHRRTMIIADKYQHNEFEFFSNQLRAISDHSNDYNPNIAIQEENVHIFTKEQISESLKQQYRQYFTGSRLFERGNIRNKFSYLETGMSHYKQFSVDTPHYHETTAEHYIILQGEQKILDLGSGKQYIARKGDFVFIPPWTKHFTKNKAGTKIFFAKAPDGKDKVEIYELPEKNHVDYDEWEKSYEVDFRNSDK